MPRENQDADFTMFVRARQTQLLRFAWFVASGSDTAAEDLVQEALTRLYGRWTQVDDPEAYARVTIIRLNVSRWRKLRREVLTPWHVDRISPVPESGDWEDRLTSAVLALPTRQRMALVLRFWCDYDDNHAADMLGCTPATVRSNIHRALHRLRDSWPAPDRLPTITRPMPIATREDV
jgi:RNA polymerase sigma-70 factor (sigma-E family)